MRENFALGVVLWLVVGLGATVAGILGILHVIFHNAVPGALLVAGGVIVVSMAVVAAVRGRPSNYPKLR